MERIYPAFCFPSVLADAGRHFNADALQGTERGGGLTCGSAGGEGCLDCVEGKNRCTEVATSYDDDISQDQAGKSVSA